MSQSWYENTELKGGNDSDVDSAYLRSLLDKQTTVSSVTQPLGVLQLGGGVNNEIKLIIKDNEVTVDLNGNSFPSFEQELVGGSELNNNSNELYEHAKFFHQANQEGGFEEDSYYDDVNSETESVVEKVKLFDYVDTIGEQ